MNLEEEWSRRDLCSNCLRECDHPLMIEIDTLRSERDHAIGKIKRIEGILRQVDDSKLRGEITVILDGSLRK